MRKVAVLSGIVIFVLFILLIFSTTIVPPRNVGVEVYFGRTGRVLSPRFAPNETVCVCC